MVFQGEDKVLTEDVIKKNVNFTNTWVEWSGKNRQQIIRSGTATGDLFVVPKKTTLWITSAWVSAFTAATGGNHAFLGIDVVNIASADSFDLVAAALDHQTGGGTVAQGSISFPMPIKVEDTDKVTIFSFGGGGDFVVRGGFTGFITPKRI